jgi:hypothetical protein
MAITCDFTARIGAKFSGAYCMIRRFAGDKTNTVCLVDVYVDEIARRTGKQVVEQVRVVMPTATDKPVMAALYDRLKAEEKFAVNVVDRLDVAVEPPKPVVEVKEAGGDAAHQ